VRDFGGEVELVSFHSTSKGFFGECGSRGGYFELCNIGSEVQEQVLKIRSLELCSNVAGQVMLECMVNPPPPGSHSHDAYVTDREARLASLKGRAVMLVEALNGLEGVSCAPVEGAMYAFPQIRLPPKAIEAAEADGKTPDAFYAFALLNSKGVCVVPGAGFLQRDGTFHFRTTFLPLEDQIMSYIQKLKAFHAEFCEQYR